MMDGVPNAKLTPCASNPESKKEAPASSTTKKGLFGEKSEAVTGLSSPPCTTGNDITPCASNPESKKEAPASSTTKKCHHVFTSAVVSSLDHCQDCRGPVSGLKWIGLTCKSQYLLLKQLFSFNFRHFS
ncbi:unnamed protein product [Arctogadus glacialis]